MVMAASTRNASFIPNEGVLEKIKSHSCFLTIVSLSKACDLGVTTEGQSMQSLYFQL